MPKIESLINELVKTQSKGDTIYAKGIFPSQRVHNYFLYKREDDNIYFSAIIAFSLHKMTSFLEDDQKEKVHGIINLILANYGDYQNKDDLKTYNFWKTKPSKHFPNGHLFSKFDFFRIPDDIDDTALVYLTQPKKKSEIQWLKQKLQLHANLVKKQAFLVPKEYQHLKVYSTWFGKNMCIEFDICALSNLMYLIFQEKLTLNEHDEDTLTFIQQSVSANDHFLRPYQISPYYPSTSLILYHIARLISKFNILKLNNLKPKIIQDLQILLASSQNKIERIILSISLLRLGEQCQDLDFKIKEIDSIKFPWFTAGMLNTFNNPITKKLAPYSFFHLKHYCQAHNITLLLEYEVLKKSHHQFT